MRLRDWNFLGAFCAGLIAIAGLVRGQWGWAAIWMAITAGLGTFAWIWNRKYPGPMPHFIRWILWIPRGPLAPERLEELLRPVRGEHILEIGPGIGIQSLPIASALQPGGVLEVLDVQQKMIDDLQRRAERAGITNIVARLGDAKELPYSDNAFDAAYLVTVLGEIPDKAAALRELRRVLKPNGRLVIGEFLVDPDFITYPALKALATEAGFTFEQKQGGRFAYLAKFRR